MVPHATIVVCTRNRPTELERCLDALGRQHYPRFDILVVDNGPGRDGVADLCRARGVACIREPQPGLTRARNLGARAARGPLVAYIDDDAVAEPGWLEALAAEFADPRVAAVAGQTRYMLSKGDSLDLTDRDAPGHPVPRARLVVDADTPGWFALACFGGIGDGNTMAFRREVLTGSVRFDERIGRGRAIDGGDEHVAFMSLISDGYRVVRAPAAVVRHPEPSTDAGRLVKRRRDLASSVAYLLFLADQFPRHRGDIAGFLARAVLRRATGGGPRGRRLPLTTGAAAAAALAGVGAFWRARKEWSSPAMGGTATPRVVTLR